MAEADEPWLKGQETTGGSPILGRIESEDCLGLAKHDPAVPDVDVAEHVARDEDPVGFAPERDMAGSVTWRFDHFEVSHLVSLAQAPGNGMRRTGPEPADRAGEPVARHPGDDLAGGLHGVSVGVAAPERDRQLGTDRVARTLMVGGGVRQGVEADRAVAEPALDAPDVEPRSRVDQYSSHQIDVYQVRWKAFEDEQVVSQLFHLIPVFLRRVASQDRAILTVLARLDTIRPDGHGRHTSGKDGSRVRLASRMIVVSLVVAAIGARVAAVWVLQSHHVPRSTYEHGEIAANLLAGRGFATHFLGADGPTSQQAPIYPAVVCLGYAVGGVERPQALLLLELGQSALAGVLVLGVLRLARSVAPTYPWVAWASGLVTALHPTLVYAATHVQVALLGTTLLVWTLAWGYQCGLSRRIRDAMIAGGLLGLLALTDPILALAAVGVAWAVFARWGREFGRAAGSEQERTARGVCLLLRSVTPIELGRSLLLVGVVAITSVVVVGPWIVRNFKIHGEFVAIKSTFGYAFWQGNCSVSRGTDKVVRQSVERVLRRDRDATSLVGLNRRLWEARHEAGYIDDIALSRDDYNMLGRVSEPERSRILFRRAVSELGDEPGRYVRLCLRRLRYFVFFDETNPKSRVMAYRLSHLGLTLFGGLGLILAGASLRKRLLPTIITVVLITVFHSLTIVSARFHIPLEPLFGVWGAAGLVHAGERIKAWLRRKHRWNYADPYPGPVARGKWVLGSRYPSVSSRTLTPTLSHRERGK